MEDDRSRALSETSDDYVTIMCFDGFPISESQHMRMSKSRQLQCAECSDVRRESNRVVPARGAVSGDVLYKCDIKPQSSLSIHHVDVTPSITARPPPKYRSDE